jgi:hypothetical protein
LILGIFAIIHEIAGYGPITVASRSLFRQFQREHGAGITFDGAQAILVAIAFISTGAAVYIAVKFARRPIIIFGYIAMAVLNFLIGIGMATDEESMAYVMMVAFTIFYQLLNGSMVWLYLAETCSDVAFGSASLLQWVTLTVVSLITPSMLRGIGSGVYFMYSVICLGSGYFCYRLMKETAPLTDRQKKLLYAMSKE